jgi:endonuclease-3
MSELVETLLSQHTSDVNSHRAFASLWQKFGSWEAVADADLREIEEAIRAGGLSRVKAPRIKQVLQQIKEKRGGYDLEFLRTLSLEEAKQWLQDLPGVGPKTAACVLLFALKRPAMVVDTHVHRVTKRLGLIGPKVSANQAHAILEAMLRPERVYAFHVGAITHGRQVCRAPRPRCSVCFLADGCPTASLYLGGTDGRGPIQEAPR